MENVDNIRNHVLKYFCGSLRLYVSWCAPNDIPLLQKFHGVERVRIAALVADFVLEQLGHDAPLMNCDSPTIRAARKMVPPRGTPEIHLRRQQGK